MKRLSAKEFEEKYGAAAAASFGKQVAPNSIFNTQAAKDVFTKAGDDFAFGKAQAQANQTTGEGDPFLGVKTAALQGATAPFRAAGAGFFGEDTKGGAALEKADIGGNLGKLGSNVINPAIDSVVGEGTTQKVGQFADDVLTGFESQTPERQLELRNSLAGAELLGGALGADSLIKNAFKSKPSPRLNADYTINPTDDLFETAATPKAASNSVIEQTRSLRENLQSFAGERGVDPQFGASAARLVEPVTVTGAPFLSGVAGRQNNVADVYDGYFAQAQSHIADAKLDPPLSQVGEDVGQAFDSVIEQQRAVGALLGEELRKVGGLRVSIDKAVENAIAMMDESGLSFNSRTKQFNSFQGNKFADSEIEMLTEFFAKTRMLGNAPTVRDIDNFISTQRSTLLFTKGSTGVPQVTNAERIINTTLHNLRESLSPEVSGIQQLGRYFDINKSYSELKDFTTEGSKMLGKVTQSGDYAKDASILKSSVQSMLNSGKKDWLLRLEELTGYPALDYSVLALQAMKDAGDYKGLSLLQAIKDQGVPTSKEGFVGAIIDKAADTGKRVVLGAPEEQTRAYLRSLGAKKTDLTKPDTAMKAPDGLPKTEKLTKLEGQVLENVKQQKQALKAGDLTLLGKLKVAYGKLITSIKAEVKFIKENIGSEAGFANLFGKDGPKQYKKYKKDTQTVKADVEDSVVVENLMNKSVIEVEPDDAVRFEALQKVANQRALSEPELAEAQAIIERVDGELPEVDGTVPATTQTTLLEEAKKFKTADEFVRKPRGNEDTLYHYTNANVGDTLKPRPNVELAEMNYLGDGVYVTNQKNGYEGKNELMAFPSKDLDILDLTTAVAEEKFLEQISKEIGTPVARSGGGLYDDLRLMASNIGENHQRVKDAVSKVSKGKDGIKANFAQYTNDDNFYELVLNEKVDVKTKAQLTDIWKQANQ